MFPLIGLPRFSGSENDVLDRYLQLQEEVEADVVVRITGDCPLVDPALVDDVVRPFKAAVSIIQQYSAADLS